MPLRFTLRQLEYFSAVSALGSIALAADKLNVSSPTISVAISHLEQEFGVPLFVRRHAAGLALTTAGGRFKKAADDILARADALRGLAGEITGKVQGSLRVGCLETFAQLVMPELRRLFEDNNRDVTFVQSQGNQMELIEGLHSAKIDVCLTYDMQIPTDCDFLPLVALPPNVMFAATHPFAGRSSISAADLVDEPMVLLDLPISANYLLSHFKDAGLRPHIVERTSDLATLRSLVANGYGYGLANVRPRSDLAPDGKSLAIVPLVTSTPPISMGLAFAKTSTRSRLIDAFVEHCRQQISSAGAPGLKLN